MKTLIIPGIFLIITLIFFYKIFLGFLPIPMDILLGGYLPWNDYSWGYPIGVPIKNPSLSDVISTSYPWKSLSMDLIRQGVFPLWNNYSFGGGPLLANWQSGVFYPLNILMLIFGNKYGWSLMVMAQPFLSLLFMYFFLKELKNSVMAALIGSVVFAFSGYFLTFLEYNYLQAGIWLPLLLFITEKSLTNSQKVKWLVFIPVIIFIIISAGNFQVTLFSLLISCSYFVFRSLNLNKQIPDYKLLFTGMFLHFIGVTFAAIQLVPTYEVFLNSIRNLDNNINLYNYGLISPSNLIRFLIPDFFGNPATWNYRGFLYHETTGYISVISICLILYTMLTQKTFIVRFFTGILIISLLLIIDSPLSRLIFELKVPLISSSYAARALYIFTFAASVLVAFGVNDYKKNYNLLLKIAVTMLSCLLAIMIGLLITKFYLEKVDIATLNTIDINISIRNTIFPLLIMVSFAAILFIKKLGKSSLIIILFLILGDLFRLGWKYNPFTPSEMFYPTTPSIEYLQTNIGQYRFEREKSEVFPPNNWIPYSLMTPEGYDPLVYQKYAAFFNVYNNVDSNSSVSRYLELGNFNSPLMDLLGVKYLIVAKRDKSGKIDPEKGDLAKFDLNRFEPVFTDKSTVILENKTVMPRVILFDKYVVEHVDNLALNKLKDGFDFRNRVILNSDPSNTSLKIDENDMAKILTYHSNEVVIETNLKNQAILMLTDTNYPGWKAYVNDKKQDLLLADGIFRAVIVPSGNSIIRFKYQPESFRNGALISLGTLLVYGMFLLLLAKNKFILK